MGSLEVKVKNNKETFTLTSYDSEVGSLEYDLKSGDFEVESSYYDEAILKGQFYIDKKEAYLAIDMEDDDVFAEFSITKDAKVQKIDGKAFDIRTADEEEFMDLLDY